MPRTPKKRPDDEKDTSREIDPSTWSEDQKRREYYYDDAHGYEVYKPEDDEEKEEDRSSK
ncbi:MAG: hypothetical protein ABIV21_01205 [Pyrinomonadaceae bacterium]